MGIAENMFDQIAPILETDEFDLQLHDVEYAGGILRVVVDKEGGVEMSAVTKATRAISNMLDLLDPISGNFTLEVTTPGLERSLKKPKHFMHAIGSDVTIKMYPQYEGDRRIAGKLTAADDDGFTVTGESGDACQLSYDDVQKARTVFTWGPQSKPGSGSKPGKSKKAGAR